MSEKNVVQQETPVTAKAAKRTKPSRAELVKRNANPESRLKGVQKTITLTLRYTSDIMHYYLETNQATMLAAYERLAGLKRMLSRDTDLLVHVDEWVKSNIQVCELQLAEIAATRDAIQNEYEIPELNVPESYQTTFVASHPIANKMITIAERVDEEIAEVESLFFAGAIDDAQYANLRNQAMTIIRGSVDRIYKATSPGSRKNGRFTPQELARWIREGNRMALPDLPTIAQQTNEKTLTSEAV